MVKIDPADEAPEELTGKEFAEYMKNKRAVPTESVADEEEVEPIAKPAIKGKQVGQMRAVKGGKPAGEVTEYGGGEEDGIDASKETFMGKHPKFAKAVDIGKKVVGTINRKTAEYVKDTEGINKKLKELQEEKEEEKEKTKEKKSSKKKSKSKKDKFDLDFDDEDEDDEDITALNKATSKQKVLPGNYKPAYGGGMGSEGYKSAYSGAGLGSGAYQPAYKTTVQTPNIVQPMRERGKEPTVMEEPPREPQRRPVSDRFNIQNWQSAGFPNTLPQNARGNLFRPAPPRPQPTVIPMVRQPYQPRPTPQPVPPMRAPARAPLTGPMPRIGLNLNTMPQLMKPRATITTPRAPGAPSHTKVPNTASLTFFGVNLNEKKKAESKPITNMGAGYKNVPLTVMNGIYPKAGYNPKTDSMTKKSIIPKISADITPNNFTMFGTKMKSRKGI